MEQYLHLFAGIYAAWVVLLLVAAWFQRGLPQRKACVLGAAGLAVAGVNLYVQPPVLHLALRCLGLGVLCCAAWHVMRFRPGGPQ